LSTRHGDCHTICTFLRTRRWRRTGPRPRSKTFLEIVRNEDGPLKTADEVEDLLIRELRRLGSMWRGCADHPAEASLHLGYFYCDGWRA
jgi:hypothetical protein